MSASAIFVARHNVAKVTTNAEVDDTLKSYYAQYCTVYLSVPDETNFGISDKMLLIILNCFSFIESVACGEEYRIIIVQNYYFISFSQFTGTRQNYRVFSFHISISSH